MPNAPTLLIASAVLAQSKPYNPVPLLMWIGALILTLALLGTAIVYLRKRTLEAQNAANVSASLMEQLRDMHKRGEISDAEYEQTRRSMASRVSQMLDTKRSEGLFELPDPKRRIRPSAMRPADRIDATDAPAQGTRQAPPGYDLTGEPLPNAVSPPERGPGPDNPARPQEPRDPHA